jgi:hypothetical protein
MPGATSGRTIVLARHGEATWTGHRFAGGTDIPLTDNGRAGAAALAASIAASRAPGQPTRGGRLQPPHPSLRDGPDDRGRD